jgi:hypothetical protein
MADNTAALISASNWMMRAWEMGNEAEYRALTAPEFRMVIYLAASWNNLAFTCFICFLLKAMSRLALWICDFYTPRLFPHTAWMSQASTTYGPSAKAWATDRSTCTLNTAITSTVARLLRLAPSMGEGDILSAAHTALHRLAARPIRLELLIFCFKATDALK